MRRSGGAKRRARKRERWEQGWGGGGGVGAAPGIIFVPPINWSLTGSNLGGVSFEGAREFVAAAPRRPPPRVLT